MRNTLKINQFGKHCLVPLRNDFFVQNRHSGPQKRPLWPFFTKKWPADGTNGQMSQIWSDQKLPQDISKLWSHWFGSFRLKKMHFHNSSVKKCRFWPKIEPKMTKFVHFFYWCWPILYFLYFILSDANLSGGYWFLQQATDAKIWPKSQFWWYFGQIYVTNIVGCPDKSCRSYGSKICFSA